MDAHHRLRNVPSEKTIENLSGNLLRPSSMTSLLRTLSNPYEKEATRGQEDAIFDLFKIPGKNEASIGRLLTVLKSYGLRVDDPRLKPMMRRLKQIEKQEEAKMNEAVEPKHWKLGRENFKECVAHSVDLIAQALRNNLVIPSWHTFIEEIRNIYQECTEISDGTVATYIPQLARQSPHLWGVSICTVDGQRLNILVFRISSAALADKSEGIAITGVVACGQVASNVMISYHGDKKLRQTTTDENGMFMMEGLILTKRKPLLHFQYNCSNQCGLSYTFNDLKKIKSGEVYDFGPIQLGTPHALLKPKKC